MTAQTNQKNNNPTTPEKAEEPPTSPLERGLRGVLITSKFSRSPSLSRCVEYTEYLTA